MKVRKASEHVPARLDHGRRAFAREHDPDLAPGAPLVAVERVVSRGRQPLEPGQDRRVRAVGARPREVGRHLAVAGGEVRELVRPEAVEALARPRARPAARTRPSGVRFCAANRVPAPAAPRAERPPCRRASSAACSSSRCATSLWPAHGRVRRPAEPRGRRPAAPVPPGRGRPAARRTGPAAGTSRRRARESRAAPPRPGTAPLGAGASCGRSRPRPCRRPGRRAACLGGGRRRAAGR